MDECVCGAVITTDDDLCDVCLSFCAKAIGVDTETFYDDHGVCQYFEVLRYAWYNEADLYMNRNNVYWTDLDTIGESAQDA